MSGEFDLESRDTWKVHDRACWGPGRWLREPGGTVLKSLDPATGKVIGRLAPAGPESYETMLRRQTNTVNWSTRLPLAQGIDFDLDEVDPDDPICEE